MPATTYASVIAMVLAALLPRFGISLSNDTLTTTVQTIVEIILGIIVYVNHKNVVAQARAGGASI